MKKKILLFLSCAFVQFAIAQTADPIFPNGESTATSNAQNQSKHIPISIGYYGHFLIQPGLKVGTEINFKKWKTEKVGKKRTFTKSKSLFVSPQIGFFARPGNHTSLLLNADLGYKRIKEKRGRNSYSAFSIGLGYLTQFQITSMVVNLNDGSIKEKNRERQAYFMPTINYELGRAINSKLGWYSKYSYGVKLSGDRDRTTVLFIEMGMRVKLM